MLDNLIANSLDLDFDIYSTLMFKFQNYSSKINCPTMGSSNIFNEFENYVKLTSAMFQELVALLHKCDEERKNFRMIVFRLSKDKMLVEKLFHEEKAELLLKRLVLHDELKNVVIDRNLVKIQEMNSMIGVLKKKLWRNNLETTSKSSNKQKLSIASKTRTYTATNRQETGTGKTLVGSSKLKKVTDASSYGSFASVYSNTNSISNKQLTNNKHASTGNIQNGRVLSNLSINQDLILETQCRDSIISDSPIHTSTSKQPISYLPPSMSNTSRNSNKSNTTNLQKSKREERIEPMSRSITFYGNPDSIIYQTNENINYDTDQDFFNPEKDRNRREIHGIFLDKANQNSSDRFIQSHRSLMKEDEPSELILVTPMNKVNRKISTEQKGKREGMKTQYSALNKESQKYNQSSSNVMNYKIESRSSLKSIMNKNKI